MCVAKRIKEIAENEGITITELERFIGASSGTLSRAASRGTDIQSKWVSKVAENYQSYSLYWLLTGEGDMLRDRVPAPKFEHSKNIATPKVTTFPQKSKERIVEYQTIPLYAVEATASILAQGDISDYIIDNISIPRMPKCDGAVMVAGDSMSPVIHSGDIVLYKVFENFNNIIYGQMYLVSIILEGDTLILIKYIRKIESDPSAVLLCSENPAHSPMQIPLSSIRSIALIKGSIRYHIM
ncbi:S24 family peptidase [Porphyromonadaceae bacterium W3.11]|nr:S24 family peptidase [Porphyromonadaceae bacterium W3.11]